MADSTKIRLVRCPKCENLLPELADYSVYQCGGCGAVLRANIRNPEADTFSEKSEEDRLGRVATKPQISSEKGIADSSDAPDADVKSSAGSLRCDQMDPLKNDVECSDRSKNEFEVAGDQWSVENGNDISRNKDEIVNSIGGEKEDLGANFGYTDGLRRLGRMSDWQAGKQEEMEGFQRIPRAVLEGVRLSTSKHPDEGPSNHLLDSSYGYGELLRNQTDEDGSSRIRLEQDRDELVRKLDELKEQLTQSCDVVDKPKEKVLLDGRVLPLESYAGADTWFPNGSSGSRKPPMPFYGPDKHAAGAGPSYFSHFPEPFAYPVGHDMTQHGLYPPMNNPNHVPACGDPYGSQMLGRALHQLPGEYQQQPPHPYFYGQYIERNHNPSTPYQQSSVLHQASCSCFHCYEKPRIAVPAPPSVFGNKKFLDVPSNPMYHIENPATFGSHFHSSRTTMPPPLNVRGTQAHARWPSDINSEMGGFIRCRPQRVVLASGGRRFRPMAGAAPFIMCYNCFELLQMPKKVQLMVKNEHKLRCGACSTVINFTVVNKKLVLRDHAESKGFSVEVGDISNEVVNDNSSHFRGRVNRIASTFSSDDFDHSGYDFQSMDRKPVAVSTGQALNSVRQPQEMQSFHSSSPSMSEDENSPDVLTTSREEVNSIRQAIKSALPSPPGGSPLQEHFDYSSSNHVVNQFGKGNCSSRSDREKVVSSKATTRQNSLKEASLPTEIEVSFNEYSNTGISQDSRDTTREDDQQKMARGGESFFANIKKKSFKNVSIFNQPEARGKSNISVNGYPIPVGMVKKAEKIAGPIHPGQYWYDFRAGFWGVLGGPCLGIIPPFIEEFNHPMPENCAGGTTGVFVNGRELHRKDLDLLANRGLSTDRDRSYIIEMSGRVLDEDTGEELDSLGKLAPTVEKAKHGFGMKVPRAAA